MIPNAREVAAAMLRPTTPVYIGAMTNRSNVGDDLLSVAHRRLLGRPVGTLAMGGRNRLLSVRLRRSPRLPLLLGGGTLIGRPAYRRALAAALDAPGADVRPSMLGPGVSAPDGTGKSTPAELAEWAPLLRRFPVVRVRGPRSATYLADVGVEAAVVGDPVLALLRPERRRPHRADDVARIGVNGADVEGMDTATTSIAAALRTIADRLDRPIQVTAIAASDYDVPANDRLAQAVRNAGIPVTAVSLCGASSAHVADVLGPLDAVVPVRLHVGVAAAALDVPCVSLPYEDKCHDFLDSVQSPPENRCAIGSATAGWLAERMDHVLTTQPATAPTADAVDRLVAAQLDAAREVVTELGLAPPH